MRRAEELSLDPDPFVGVDRADRRGWTRAEDVGSPRRGSGARARAQQVAHVEASAPRSTSESGPTRHGPLSSGSVVASLAAMRFSSTASREKLLSRGRTGSTPGGGTEGSLREAEGSKGRPKACRDVPRALAEGLRSAGSRRTIARSDAERNVGSRSSLGGTSLRAAGRASPSGTEGSCAVRRRSIRRREDGTRRRGPLPRSSCSREA